MAAKTVRVATIGSGSGDRLRMLQDLAPAAVQVEAYEPRIASFPRTPYDRLLVEIGFVDMAERAATDGCDAIFIDTTCDYGIGAIRSAISLPVVGAGETAIRAAAEDGRRYSIVTVWPESLNYLNEERLHAVSGGDQCVAVRNVSPEEELAKVGTDEGVMNRMHRGDPSIVDRLVEECERAVEDDRVDCIVFGCTCMAPVAPDVAARVPVPVIEACRTGFAATLASLSEPQDAQGVAMTARVGFISSLVGAWLGEQAPSVPDADDCPVCVTLA